MKHTKSIIAALLSAVCISGCGSSAAAASTAAESTASVSSAPAASTAAVPSESAESSVDGTEIHISAMKGPTAMGMVKLMDDVDQGNVKDYSYSFELLSSVDEIAPKVAQGEVDIAAVPANLGSVLYNNTDHGVEALAINTLGVLYICETGDSIHSVSDLRGKTIYASGKGATPEYALDYILNGNGINPDADVTIEWKSEHAECVAALAQDPDGIAMLPQPFVTAAQAKNDSIKVALDLTEEWNKVQENSDEKSTLITGIVIARKQFAEEHPDAVEDFLKRYKESVDYVNANTDQAAELIGNYDIIASAVAKKALPACNIVYIDGDEMKTGLSGYLNILYQANPKSVGGSLPEDDFYYSAG